MLLRTTSRLTLALAALAPLGFLLRQAAAFTEDPARLIRSSEALPAEQELRSFHVPEGFEVQLVADEDQLGGKPVNMAFDTKGRLWVTVTKEYPYAVPKARWSPDTTRALGSKDTVRILDELAPGGRAGKISVFADDMNINTGITPYKDGCIAWSIPNILFLEDTKGTGKADKRTILFGPLGYERDTHGMISSIRVGPDGWVYATHGFSNTSHFKAKDGSAIDLTSGNVFRFRPDGSHVEVWTSGQVNPFGLNWDSWGNLYSSDCHSSPIYQLMKGACYPSFGRPHDGLGFAPIMCDHAHGSTGIAGIVYIDGGIWGPEWDNHSVIGNPVTSKINHDHVTFAGSSPKANEEPDFLVSDDLWFRPVDLQLGPDGALYIADFYNKIIAHYELPLDHPERDRNRGRIWRVVRKGHHGALKPFEPSIEKAAVALESPNLTVRRLAIQYLNEHPLPAKAPEGLSERALAYYQWPELQAERREQKPLTNPLPPLSQLLERSESAMTTVQVLRQVAEFGLLPGCTRDDLAKALHNGEAQVRRAATFALQCQPDLVSLPPLLTALDGTPKDDAHLKHAVRLALREQLKLNDAFADLAKRYAKEAPSQDVLTLVQAIPTAESAEWLFAQLQTSTARKKPLPASLWQPALTFIARHLPADREGDVIQAVLHQFADNLDVQMELFAAIQEGQQAQGGKLGERARGWAASMAEKLLAQITDTQKDPGWKPTTTPTPANPSPWIRKKRKCTDGQEVWMLDSLPDKGEKLTGTLRSPTFDLPATLSFWIAGHRGKPNTPAHDKNLVRVVNADTGEELKRAYPPRNDVAQQVRWEFGADHPKKAYFELIDGDDGPSYAWLAAGRFEPEVVNVPEIGPHRTDQEIRSLSMLAKAFNLVSARAALAALPKKADLSPDTRQALAEVLAISAPGGGLDQFASLARDGELAQTTFATLEAPAQADTVLDKAFHTLPFRTQVKLANALSANVPEAQRLLKLAPPRVLADPLVVGRIKALHNEALSQALTKITSSLPPGNKEIDALIAKRMHSFNADKSDEGRGEKVFMTTCSICHRIGIKGNIVGPQLDGVGTRGVERLLEDILDPNRSVDPAFRLHFVKMKNGDLVAGLLRREDGSTLVFADAAGQEHKLQKAEIEEDKVSEFSLMPAGFGEVLTEDQLHDLLKFLLARKS